MKAEDYTHRIGRTGRAGRDGLAVTFAEFRDRRKIFDIEAYSRQPIKPETIPGLEPQQRAPESRPSFGGRGRGGDFQPRERKFGGPREGGFGGGQRDGALVKVAMAQCAVSADALTGGGRGFGESSRDFGGASREGFSYERKGGFNDRFAGQGAPRGDAPRGDARPPRGDFQPRGDFGAPRGDFGAPRGDFAARKPAFGKPAGLPSPVTAARSLCPAMPRSVPHATSTNLPISR